MAKQRLLRASGYMINLYLQGTSSIKKLASKGFGGDRGISLHEINDKALSIFGEGAHTLMDETSPAHWDYVDPHLHESVAHYVDAVEGFQ